MHGPITISYTVEVEVDPDRAWYSSIMSRRCPATLALIGAAVFLTARPARADCVDVGCIVDPIVYAVVVPAIVGGVVAVGVDTYVTVADVSGAARHEPPSSGRSNFEVAFGGTQAALGGTFGGAAIATGGAEWGMGALAFSTWPLALAMHGQWGQTDDPYGGFPVATLPVAGVDLGILGYDVVRMARHERT